VLVHWECPLFLKDLIEWFQNISSCHSGPLCSFSHLTNCWTLRKLQQLLLQITIRICVQFCLTSFIIIVATFALPIKSFLHFIVDLNFLVHQYLFQFNYQCYPLKKHKKQRVNSSQYLTHLRIKTEAVLGKPHSV